jgi:hypothetical protein
MPHRRVVIPEVQVKKYAGSLGSGWLTVQPEVTRKFGSVRIGDNPPRMRKRCILTSGLLHEIPKPRRQPVLADAKNEREPVDESDSGRMIGNPEMTAKFPNCRLHSENPCLSALAL